MTETKTKVKGGSFLLGMPSTADTFISEEFSQDQKMIAQTAREMADKIFAKLEEIETDKPKHSRAFLRELGELGLLGIEFPEEYGGMGLDKITATVATEELSRTGPFGVTIGAHNGIGSLPIVYFGNAAQKAKYLPKLATGEWVGAYALTEPGSGSDAMGARTTAVLTPDGKHYVLNGTKQWITNSAFADVFIVYAKIDGDKFSAFIVERTYPGVSVGPEENKMGLHASSTCSLILEDVKVPVENLLGEIGKGHVIAFNILNIGRWKLGAGMIGSCKQLIEASAEYANTRHQFQKPIGSFRAIQQKLADMNMKTFVLEALAYRTAGLIDANLQGLDINADGREAGKRIEEYAVECSIAKVFGSEVLDFVADEAVQIHGGYGYMEEYAVCRGYRDARINRIFEGTNEINRLLIPGTLVKRTMKGELPLMKAMLGLQDELMSLTPFEDDGSLLAQEKFLIDRAKKIFLMLAGLGVQKFQMALEHEQELLLGLADIVIEIFAMESAVLRAQKASEMGKAGLKVEMSRAYCQDAFERIGSFARQILPNLEEEGDMLRTQLSILKRLTRYTPVNTVNIKRNVAAKVLDKVGYVC